MLMKCRKCLMYALQVERSVWGASGEKSTALSGGASVKDGVMTITLNNCFLAKEVEIECDVCHFAASRAEARILMADPHAFNDFDHPDDVVIQPFTAAIENGKLRVTLPLCSVVIQ